MPPRRDAWVSVLVMAWENIRLLGVLLSLWITVVDLAAVAAVVLVEGRGRSERWRDSLVNSGREGGCRWLWCCSLGAIVVVVEANRQWREVMAYVLLGVLAVVAKCPSEKEKGAARIP